MPERASTGGELSCAVFVGRRKKIAYPQVDLRVDYHPQAVSQLRRLYEYAQPLDHYYEGYAASS